MVGRSVRILAGICLLAQLAIPATGQAPPPPTVDIRVGSLELPQSLAVDVDNVITATLRNQRATASSVEYRFEAHEAGTPTRVVAFAEDSILIAPNSAVQVQGTWRGRDGAQPMKGPVNVRVTAFDAGPLEEATPEDNVKSASGFLAYHQLAAALRQGPGASPLDPGVERSWVVDIGNRGNVDEQASVSLVNPTVGWGFTVGPAALSLPAGGTDKPVQVFFKVPQDGAVGSQGTVQLQATTPSGTGVASLTLTTPPVGTGGIVSLVGPPTIPHAEPDSLVAIPLVLVNNRNEPHRVTIASEPGNPAPPGELVFDPEGPFDLAPRQSLNLVAEVSLPADQPAGQVAWQLVAQPAGAVPPTILDLVLEVDQVHRFDVSSPTTTTLEPAAEGTLCFDTKNEGNADDTVSLALTQLPTGWKAPATPTVPILAGQMKPLCIDVTVPPETPSEDVLLQAQAWSTGATVPGGVRSFTVRVLPLAVAQSSTAFPNLPIARGETVQFDVLVKNIGNKQATFTLNATPVSAPPGEGLSFPDRWMPVGWKLEQDPEQVTLASGQVGLWQVNVTAPNAPLEPEDILHVEVKMSALGARSAPVLQLAAKPAYPDLVVSVNATTPYPAYKDQPATVGIGVLNNGTASTVSTHRLRVEFLTPQGTQASPPVIQDLASLGWVPGGRHVLVQVPLPTSFASMTVKAKVDSLNAIDEALETNNDGQKLVLLRTFNVKINGPPDTTALPSQRLLFTQGSAFTVRNEGTHIENITLRLQADPAVWASSTAFGNLPHLNVTLAPVGQQGSAITVPAELAIPRLPGRQQAQVVLRANLQEMPALSAQDAIRIKITDEKGPEIGGLRAEGSALLGQPQQFIVEVVDETGISEVRLVATSPGGQVVRAYLSRTTGANYTGQIAWQSAGEHTVIVEAVDNATGRNRADTAVNPLRIQVRSNATVQVSLVSPAAGSPIRPGQSLTFSVASTQQIAQASYTLSNDTVPLAPTPILQVPTEGWQDGVQLLKVALMTVQGQRHEANFTVRVDGTGPALTAPRIAVWDLGRFNVSVQATDPSGLGPVGLRVVSASGAGLAVPLNRTGDRYWAIVAFPVDTTLATFVAEDSLGNLASLHQALDPPGAQGAPAPPLALLALALLWLARRSRHA